MTEIKPKPFMSTVKVGSKGQIVIPKEIREMFAIQPGDSLIIMAEASKGIAIQRQNVLEEIARAIFSGNGKAIYPTERDENLKKFASTVQNTIESEEPKK